MIILVTTNKTFTAIDTVSGRRKVIDSGRGLYYGITYSDDTIFVAARNNLESGSRTTEERDKEEGVVLMYDYDLSLRGELCAPFPLRDLHQIIYAGDKLWLTCSFDDMVAIYDFSTWEKWYPSPDPLHHGKDTHHFNSLWTEGDDIYVLGHNKGPSELWRFDTKERVLKEKINLGNTAHNIWRRDGELVVCDSQFGALAGEKGFSLKTGGFPRGVVITEQFQIVGVSELAARSERDNISSCINIYDSDWKKLSEILIEDEGQLLEIRSPGLRDIASPGLLGKVPVLG